MSLTWLELSVNKHCESERILGHTFDPLTTLLEKQAGAPRRRAPRSVNHSTCVILKCCLCGYTHSFYWRHVDYVIFWYLLSGRWIHGVWVIPRHRALGATFIPALSSSFFVWYTTFIWPFGAWQTIPPSLMSAVTLRHWLSLLFPIIQVKPFIAPDDNVDISGLWLNVCVFPVVSVWRCTGTWKMSPLKTPKQSPTTRFHSLPRE